jgi:Rieske 2Fe-2S protein
MFVALVSRGVAALVVRGDDGVLRAFSGTCRHRDPMVVAERAGAGMSATSAFACPFAGWPGPHAGTGPVRPLPVTQAHGVVLVRPRGDAPIASGESVDVETAAWLDRFALDHAECVAETRDVVTADWLAVVAELASRPRAGTVAAHAVFTAGAGDGTLELDRVFALDSQVRGGRCVVDRRRYQLRA